MIFKVSCNLNHCVIVLFYNLVAVRRKESSEKFNVHFACASHASGIFFYFSDLPKRKWFNQFTVPESQLPSSTILDQESSRKLEFFC